MADKYPETLVYEGREFRARLTATRIVLYVGSSVWDPEAAYTLRSNYLRKLPGSCTGTRAPHVMFPRKITGSKAISDRAHEICARADLERWEAETEALICSVGSKRQQEIKAAERALLDAARTDQDSDVLVFRAASLRLVCGQQWHEFATAQHHTDAAMLKITTPPQGASDGALNGLGEILS